MEKQKEIDVKKNNCAGCGKPATTYSTKYKLYLCGKDTCKPQDVMFDLVEHAVFGR